MAFGSTAAIGSVSAATGGASVCVQGVDVIERPLQPGTELHADEVLRVPKGAELRIALVDGSEVVLQAKGQGREIALDHTGIEQLRAETAALEQPDDVDALQAALLAGEDPDQLAATAAGPAGPPGNEGGSSFVRVGRDGARGRVDRSDLDTDDAGNPIFLTAGQPDLVPPGQDPVFVPPGQQSPDSPEPPPEPPAPPEPPEPPPEPPAEPPTTARSLDVIIDTNSPDASQVALFTFTQGGETFWTLLSLGGEGRSSALSEQWDDYGFDIDLQGSADVTLEWISSANGNISINEFSVDGIVIQSTSTHTIENSDGAIVNKPKLVDSESEQVNNTQGDTIRASLDLDDAEVDGASIEFPRLVSGDDDGVLTGGDGNDLLLIEDDSALDLSALGAVDAGDGIDMLTIKTSDGDYDLADDGFQGSSLEIVNLLIDPRSARAGEESDNTLRLDAADILDLGASDQDLQQLYVVGDSADTLVLKDADNWSRIEGDTDADGWTSYTQTVAGVTVNLHVLSDVSITSTDGEPLT